MSVPCFFDRELRSNSLMDKLVLNIRGLPMMMIMMIMSIFIILHVHCYGYAHVPFYNPALLSLVCHVGLHLRSLVEWQRICKACEGSSVLSQYILFLGTKSINKAQRGFFL